MPKRKASAVSVKKAPAAKKKAPTAAKKTADAKKGKASNGLILRIRGDRVREYSGSNKGVAGGGVRWLFRVHKGVTGVAVGGLWNTKGNRGGGGVRDWRTR